MRLQQSRWCQAGVAVLALCVAAACASPQPPPASPADQSYRVGPPDELEITVLPEPVITKDVIVRPDGRFSFELIGDVDAQGRTVAEISEQIESRIARYKRNASVSVSVKEAASPTVTIFGQVSNPTVLPLTREIRVAEILGEVGGTTIFAKKSGIRVIRTDGNSTKILPVDLAGIQAGDLSTNIVLQRGDIIVVPPNFFARISFAMQILLLPIQPLMGAAGAAAAVTAF